MCPCLVYLDSFKHSALLMGNIHNQLLEAPFMYRKQKLFQKFPHHNIFLYLTFFYSVVAHHFNDLQDLYVTEQNVNHVHQMNLVQQDKYAVVTHVNQDIPVTWNKFN